MRSIASRITDSPFGAAPRRPDARLPEIVGERAASWDARRTDLLPAAGSHVFLRRDPLDAIRAVEVKDGTHLVPQGEPIIPFFAPSSSSPTGT